MELHFPRHIASEYLSKSPNIFDSEFVFGVDRYVFPWFSPEFAVIYYRVRDKLRGWKIPDDIQVYYFTKDKAKEYYVCRVVLRRALEIDRLITVHATVSYRLPIADFLKGLYMSEFKSLQTYRNIIRLLNSVSIPSVLVGNRKVRICMNSSVVPISLHTNYFSPLSLSAQLAYGIAKFISDFGLVNEYLSNDLANACEDYEKSCEHVIEKIKPEIQALMAEDKLNLVIEAVLKECPSGKVLTIPVVIGEIISKFNKAHGTDFTVESIIRQVERLYRSGRIVLEDGKGWVLR
jgi:hypothetical protein